MGSLDNAKIQLVAQSLLKPQEVTNQPTQAWHESVPSDVWNLIFELTSAEYFKYPPRAHHSPWNLRQVCSRWRSIVVGHPTLWNRVQFPYSLRPKASNLQFWMRTIIHQSAPVSLNLTCYDSPDRLLYSLAVQPLHMQLVSLRMALTPQFLLMPHDSFPQLQTLDLTIIWAGLFTDTKMISTYTAASCFLGMRNLHTLRLCFKDDVDAVPDTIPWSQITSLTLVSDDIESGADALGVDNVLSILKQSFSLRKCHLHLAMDNVTHSSMVTLPNLRELEVQHHTYGGEYEGSLLDLLITPALGSLSLETTADYRDSFEIPDFRSLILRSGCHLHLLSLDQTWLELSDADLHSISSVQSLYVPHVFFDTEMLSQVVNGNLLPAIENISLGVESIEHIELLTELIERRSECALKEENHLQVKEVRIAFAYDKANMKAMMRCLKLAKRCGTKLCIYDGQKSWSEKYVSLEEDDGVSQGNSGKE